MNSSTQSGKAVSVAQNAELNEWMRQSAPDHEPVIDLEEDIVGSKNHLLG
jgi:hypothetical protein